MQIGHVMELLDPSALEGVVCGITPCKLSEERELLDGFVALFASTEHTSSILFRLTILGLKNGEK